MAEHPTSDGLLKKLYELHAPIRVPTIGEYQYACGEAAREIERLRIDNEALALTCADNINEKQQLRVELFNLRGRP